jgi:hypothetical protein
VPRPSLELVCKQLGFFLGGGVGVFVIFSLCKDFFDVTVGRDFNVSFSITFRLTLSIYSNWVAFLALYNVTFYPFVCCVLNRCYIPKTAIQSILVP